jgi:aryl-alcohol dehydrogenase-like predicted oxidoreductase
MCGRNGCRATLTEAQATSAGCAAPYAEIGTMAGATRRTVKRSWQEKEKKMKTRKLGNSDLRITPIGFGSWAIGGSGWEFAWGAQNDVEAIAAIREALDCGINWIDTAAVYGLGHSEELVARALEGRRERPYVFTKCSLVWDEQHQIHHSLKVESIRRECEASLRRLKTDAIDLYQIHWPDPDEDIEEGWATLANLQEEGKVRWIGVSNFDAAQMQRAHAIAPITSLQPPYSLVRRDVEKGILPFATRHDMGVIAYSPMASGLLTGAMTRARVAGLPDDDWRKKHTDFQEPLLTRNLMLVEKLKDIAAWHGRTPGQVAVAWVLHNPAVTGAIVGARKPGQILDTVCAADFRLSRNEMAEIEAFFAKRPLTRDGVLVPTR